MIALLNMAIMDKTAMIRTAPKMNMIIFSRLLLLLSKSTSPLCLDFEADMSISQEDELFYCKYGTTTHTIKIGKLKSCKEANLTLLPLYSPRRSVVQ